MIVKNEAHVIKRCLNSVAPFISTWVIVDTGSTDGTQQLIREYFDAAKIPGQLFERPWKDFGTNRTEALKLARPNADYTLFIDADEIFEMPPNMALPELTADGYLVLHQNGYFSFSFWRMQFVSNKKPWYWQGVLHEALTCDEPQRIERIEGPVTRGMFDSARNRLPQEEKYRKDALVLEQALVTEPNNARYVFYLGQSWRDAKQYDKSLDAYRKRAQMSGWEEEGWYAQYQVAKQLESLGRRAESIEHYLIAYNRRPSRAEPLCDLARIHRESNAFHVAFLFASRAIALTRPDDTLFVDDSVYEWRALDEYSIASYWVDDFAECARVAEALLNGGRLPEQHRERIEKNRQFALSKLKGT
jgi:tetratricopeptide (TPR) repeat protein